METTIQEKVATFFEQFKSKTYKTGEILIQADENPTGILYLKKGIVREYAISQKGEEIVVNLFKQSTFFPMSWALVKTPNKYFFEATTDVEIYKAPVEKVLQFLQENPDVSFDLLSRLYKGIDGLLTRMVYLMSGSAYTRLIAEILICAKRFGIKEEGGIVSCNITETELASQSGMTRETVSREIKRLKDKKLVTIQKNKLTIPNLEKLEAELQEDF